METRQPTIGASEFTNFLQTGALLRPSANLWFLLMGPFVEKSELTADEAALFHPDFFMGPTARYWVPASIHRMTDEGLRSLCKTQKRDETTPSSVSWNWQGAHEESFETSFHEIATRMVEHKLKKAVPIVFENSDHSVTAEDRLKMIEALMAAPANLYIYGFWQNGEGVLGATPEVLLRQDGDSLSTMALAGTCPKEDLAQRKSLLEDAKELHEHELVAQDVVQSLNQYGLVRTDGPKLLELPTLFHLKTDIQCQLFADREFHFFEACKKLHPTPALGVSPRSFGIEWMKELPEQVDRKGFGAPWGLKWSSHEALCLVAIRNIQWTPHGSRIGSGCGIVQQSNLQQEWRELFQKRLSVKRVLGLQS